MEVLENYNIVCLVLQTFTYSPDKYGVAEMAHTLNCLWIYAYISLSMLIQSVLTAPYAARLGMHIIGLSYCISL